MKKLLLILAFAVPAVIAMESPPKSVDPAVGMDPKNAGAQELAMDVEQSELFFISIKNDNVAEAHQFRSFDGSIGANGKATIRIDLSSLDTGIKIRDKRMRDFLFETGKFGEAVFEAQVDTAAVNAMKAGESKRMALEGKLRLHGKTGDLTFEVLAFRRADGALVVSTVKPAVIVADRYDLTDGIGKLRSVAGLNSIDGAVPVAFYAVFR